MFLLVKKKEEENEVAVITCSAFVLLSSDHHVEFQNYYMQVPATLLFTYQDFIEEIYKRENNPSEQRAQSHNIRLVFNGIRNPGRYCAIKHISCKKPKQNKPQ
jgi:hypothetical protein